jgi:hypothetical protein
VEKVLEVEVEAAVVEAMNEVERLRGLRLTPQPPAQPRECRLPSRCPQVVESRCPRRCRRRWPEPRRRSIPHLGACR